MIFTPEAEEHISAATSESTLADKLAGNRELLQSLIDSIPVMLTIYNPHLKHFRFNRKLQEVLGWTETDAVEGDLMSKVYPDADYRQMVADYMQSLEPGWKDLKATAKDGSIIESSWANIRLSDDTIVGIGVDIRKRKEAAEALAKEQRLLQTVLDSVSVGVVLADADGNITFSNPGVIRMLGGPVTGTAAGPAPGSYEILKPDGTPFPSNELPLVRSIQDNESLQNVEMVFRRLDGSEIYILANSASVRDNEECVIGAVMSMQDITRRKQAEIALRRYQLFSDSTRDIILFIRRDGRIIEANRAAVDACGYTREELLNLTIFDLRSMETAQQIESQMAAADAHGILFETVYRRKDGSTLPVEVSSHSAKIDGERVLLSVGRDITRRKQAEQSLKESEAFRAKVLDSSMNGLYLYDIIRGQITFMNKQYTLLTGYTLEDINSREGEDFLELFHSEDRARVQQHIQQIIESVTDEVPEIEYRFRRSDGRWIWCLSHESVFLRDSDRKVQQYIGTFVDITERKQAEEVLRRTREEAERRAAELISYFESMAEGAVLLDSEGRIAYMNDAGKEILGIPADGPVPTDPAEFTTLTIDGEPVERRQKASYRALRGDNVKDFRHKAVTPGGKEVTISTSAAPVCDASGRVVGATMVFRDISQAVQFERQQEELLKRERHISEVLQKSLIPEAESVVPGGDIALRYEAALREAEVGGDFYDVFGLGDDKFGILIGDVAGKGLEAAIQVASVRYAIRSYAYIDPRPDRVMTLANEALTRDPTSGAVLVTAFFAVLDVNVGLMSYANAGHEIPLLHRYLGPTEELEVEGMALAVMPGHEYLQRSALLHDGDFVVLFTDGVTEARQEPTKLFGLEGVKSYVSSSQVQSAAELADGLLEVARNFAGGALRDDAAVVVFGFRKDRTAGVYSSLNLNKYRSLTFLISMLYSEGICLLCA